jgi:hypothetical protein
MNKKKNSKRQKKQTKWKAGLKAGCLALGMATAWGGEARGDVILSVSATPTTRIYDAFVYYGVGVHSIVNIQSLGILEAGTTTNLSYPLPGEVNDYWSSYVLIGLYDAGGSEGMVISFPNDDPIMAQQEWADVFPRGYSPGYYTESLLIDEVHQAVAGNAQTLGWDLYYLSGFCGKEMGQQSTLLRFSEASDGGFATVSIVPEPAAWILLIGAAGSLLFWRRDLLTTRKESS